MPSFNGPMNVSYGWNTLTKKVKQISNLWHEAQHHRNSQRTAAVRWCIRSTSTLCEENSFWFSVYFHALDGNKDVPQGCQLKSGACWKTLTFKMLWPTNYWFHLLLTSPNLTGKTVQLPVGEWKRPQVTSAVCVKQSSMEEEDWEDNISKHCILQYEL